MNNKVTLLRICHIWQIKISFGESCLWWNTGISNLPPQETIINLKKIVKNNHLKVPNSETKTNNKLRSIFFSLKKNCWTMDKNSECLWHSCRGNALIPWLMLSLHEVLPGWGWQEKQHLCCQSVSTWIGKEGKKPISSCAVPKNSKQGRKRLEGAKNIRLISLRLWSCCRRAGEAMSMGKIGEGFSSPHIPRWLGDCVYMQRKSERVQALYIS